MVCPPYKIFYLDLVEDDFNLKGLKMKYRMRMRIEMHLQLNILLDLYILLDIVMDGNTEKSL